MDITDNTDLWPVNMILLCSGKGLLGVSWCPVIKSGGTKQIKKLNWASQKSGDVWQTERVTVCHLEVESAWEINSEYVFTSSWHELCAPRTVTICGHHCSWRCFFSMSAPSRMHHGWFLVCGTPSSHPLCSVHTQASQVGLAHRKLKQASSKPALMSVLAFCMANERHVSLWRIEDTPGTLQTKRLGENSEV